MKNRLEIYRKLFLMREVEESLRRHYSENEIKTPIHLGLGAEAIALGVLNATPRPFKFYSSYRSHNLFIAETEDLDAFFGEMYGRASGVFRGRGGSMHLSHPSRNFILSSAVVSSLISIAAGHALAEKMKKSNERVLVFFGDGATEEGSFWETLNFASLHKLPLTMICEDNDLAIHSSKNQRQSFNIQKAVESFGGMYLYSEAYHYDDVLARTQQASQASHEFSFLHFKYLRLCEHVGPLEDWSAGYRPMPENISNFDPIFNFRAQCLKENILEADLLAVETAAKARVETARNKASLSLSVEPAELTQWLFKDEA